MDIGLELLPRGRLESPPVLVEQSRIGAASIPFICKGVCRLRKCPGEWASRMTLPVCTNAEDGCSVEPLQLLCGFIHRIGLVGKSPEIDKAAYSKDSSGDATSCCQDEVLSWHWWISNAFYSTRSSQPPPSTLNGSCMGRT